MVNIRAATTNDYSPVCDLFGQLDAHHVNLDSDAYQSFEGDRRPLEHFASFLTSDAKAFFVAEDGGEIVAFLNCELGASPPYPMFRPQRIVKILNIFVRPDKRRCGLARALVDAVKQWGTEREADKLQLAVHAANTDSISAYRRLGFGDFTYVMGLRL